jgi:serine/threonine-protein kinase
VGPPSAHDPWAPGGQIGQLRLLKVLGAGGMGQVFLAQDAATGARYAVKTLFGQADADERARFLREGEAQARVDGHRNVVRVHSAGEAGGRPYLVLEAASGGDLKQRLDQAPLSPEDARRLGIALAGGLAHLHAHGVLHRDLKAANVLFDARGTPKLVDFGLARVEDAQSLTKTGEIMGTPSMMAPEQAQGLRHQVDARTDVYGLGALLYHCLAGRPPFAKGSVLATLDAVVREAPRPLSGAAPGVPQDLAQAVHRALEKDPARRFPSAEAFAAALGGADSPRDRRPLAGGLAATALGLAALLAAGVWAFSETAGTPPAPPAPPPPEAAEGPGSPGPAAGADPPPTEGDPERDPERGDAPTGGPEPPDSGGASTGDPEPARDEELKALLAGNETLELTPDLTQRLRSLTPADPPPEESTEALRALAGVVGRKTEGEAALDRGVALHKEQPVLAAAWLLHALDSGERQALRPLTEVVYLTPRLRHPSLIDRLVVEEGRLDLARPVRVHVCQRLGYLQLLGGHEWPANPQRAVELFEKAIDLVPQGAELKFEEPQLLAAAHYTLGLLRLTLTTDLSERGGAQVEPPETLRDYEQGSLDLVRAFALGKRHAGRELAVARPRKGERLGPTVLEELRAQFETNPAARDLYVILCLRHVTPQNEAEAARAFEEDPGAASPERANFPGWPLLEFAQDRERAGDLKQASDWYERAAQTGLPNAHAGVGNVLLKRKEPEAFDRYKRAAEAGVRWGELGMGQCYQEGLGTPRDLEQARRTFQSLTDDPNKDLATKARLLLDAVEAQLAAQD